MNKEREERERAKEKRKFATEMSETEWVKDVAGNEGRWNRMKRERKRNRTEGGKGEREGVKGFVCVCVCVHLSNQPFLSLPF